VLVGGRRMPIAGRVTMDFTMVACGEGEGAVCSGSAATLIGSDGGDTIGLDDFAAMAGTISYEILTGLGHRVARVYR
jgi:alanine racemase